jgi:hypothetical protein
MSCRQRSGTEKKGSNVFFMAPIAFFFFFSFVLICSLRVFFYGSITSVLPLTAPNIATIVRATVCFYQCMLGARVQNMYSWLLNVLSSQCSCNWGQAPARLTRLFVSKLYVTEVIVIYRNTSLVLYNILYDWMYARRSCIKFAIC